MLTVRKLTSDEVDAMLASNAQKESKSRLVTMGLYDSLVADYTTGEFAEVQLSDGEKKLTVKKQIDKALTRRGLAAVWKRAKRNQSDILRFMVTE